MLVRFYLAIVQAFVLFGAETWVVTPRIRRVLGGGSTTRSHDG